MARAHSNLYWFTPLGKLFAALWATLVWSAAWALNPTLEVSQYGHRAWRELDGFGLGVVVTMAQTTDGYMWFATPDGLVRFDGVRGVPWVGSNGSVPRYPFVRAMLAGRRGELWIGTDGGLTRIQNNTLDPIQALRDHAINVMEEDADGTLWVGGSEHGKGFVCTVQRDDVRCHNEDPRLGRAVVSLRHDATGAVWVASTDSVWKWGSKPQAFQVLTSALEAPRTMVSSAAGGVIVAVHDQVLQFTDGGVTRLRLPPLARALNFIKVLRDRDGSLWLGGADFGLVHLRAGVADIYRSAEGLSSDHVLDLFEDREGNVWVSTSRGIDQFRPQAAGIVARGLEGRSRSVLITRDGTKWAGTTKGIYTLSSRGEWEKRRAVSGALFEDREGRVWSRSQMGLGSFGYFQGGRFVTPAGIRQGPVDSMIQDTAGSLWLAHRTEGLVELRPDGHVSKTSWAALGIADPVSAMEIESSDDSLWLGLSSGTVVRVSRGQVVRHATVERSSYGRIFFLKAGANGDLWIGSRTGLSVLKEGRVATLDLQHGLPCPDAYSLVTDERSAWILLRCGLARIDRHELEVWRAELETAKSPQVQIELFDRWNGVGSAVAVAALGTLTAPYTFTSLLVGTGDGRLWGVTADSFFVLDSNRIPHNEVAPPVHVERVISDGIPFAADSKPHLPPLQRDLSIEYTGLSFTVPERVRFRYKLEGRDADWQDAGNRRQAFYTDLAPGHYRFHVVASNDSGVWNEVGDSITFSIEPAWWQTHPFRIACVVALGLLLVVGYRLRIAQVSRRLGLSLEARVNERTRIARELHDTLLQTFQGLVLRLQTARLLMPQDEGLRILDEGIAEAAEAITEGRNAVQGLRSTVADSGDLADALRSLGQALAADPGTASARFGVEFQGRPRPIHPIVRDEVFRIAGEAMRNAFRHSESKRVEVDIRYGEHDMSVLVRDDGKGMDRHVALRGRDGHFGLHGMRERARLIGARLTFRSRLGAGTEVELTVLADRAYVVEAELVDSSERAHIDNVK